MDESYNSIGDDDERSRLLQTHPPGSVYSPGDVVGAPSTILEPPNVYKSRWRSIRVMYLTMFLSSVSFSICMSSIWPYLELLDSTATTDFLGWVVAAYSLGQLIASPIFGIWANKREKSREPLVVSIIINILANILYAYTGSVPSHKALTLLIARALIGFGAGNVAVVRSYVAGATTTKERTVAMANMSAFQAIGFIFGPSIQTALVPIGYPGFVNTPGLRLNMYTMPAWLSAIVGIINIILLIVVFREHRVTNDEDINYSLQNSDGDALDYKPDVIAVVSSLLLFFIILFVFAVFETIGSPLTMHMFSWTKSEATLYIGIILAGGGVISIVAFMIIKVLSKRVNERYLLLAGLIFCMAGFIAYLPWGHNYPNYQISDLKPGMKNSSDGVNMTTPLDITTLANYTTIPELTTEMNITTPIITTSMFTTEGMATTDHLTTHDKTTADHMTSVHIPTTDHMTTIKRHVTTDNHMTSAGQTGMTVNVPGFSDSVLKADHNSRTDDIHLSTMYRTTTESSKNKTDKSEVEAVGCPDTYSWCAYTPRLNYAQFFIGTLFIVIGYPTCNVMTYTLYSKILGPKPQGTMMGWLTASGSGARTLGPIFVSQIYNSFGPRVTFAAMCAVVLVSIFCFLGVFKKLVPFKFRPTFS